MALFSRQFHEKWAVFRQKKLSYYSLWGLCLLFFLSLFAEFLANDKPLLVYFKGRIFVPIMFEVSEAEYGGEFTTRADYTDPYIQQLINANGFMINPPIGYHYRTLARDIAVAPSPPDSNHWLGTDDEAGDVLARILYGFRLSMVFGLILSVISTIIGVLVGVCCGYYGGRLDLLTGRFLEIWGGMPVMFLLIILSSFIAPSFFSLLSLMILFSWTAMVGYVRAESLKQRQLDYIKAAKAMGLTDRIIITRHLLPNSLNAAIATLPFIVAGSITALTALDFIGFGLPPGNPSLGALLKQGKENLHAPWLGLSGFMVIGLTLAMLITIGEGLRDALDVRRKI